MSASLAEQCQCQVNRAFLEALFAGARAADKKWRAKHVTQAATPTIRIPDSLQSLTSLSCGNTSSAMAASLPRCHTK